MWLHETGRNVWVAHNEHRAFPAEHFVHAHCTCTERKSSGMKNLMHKHKHRKFAENLKINEIALTCVHAILFKLMYIARVIVMNFHVIQVSS